jgi:hypothetical protein
MEGSMETMNPITKLWMVVNTSHMLHRSSFEYMKLVDIAIVLVLESMEDECIFLTVPSMKDKLKNQHQIHVLVVTMHGQIFYNIDNFPTIRLILSEKLHLVGK